MSTQTSKKVKPAQKSKWYARAKGIYRMGPYSSQEFAWKALMTTEGVPAPEACVWFGPGPTEDGL